MQKFPNSKNCHAKKPQQPASPLRVVSRSSVGMMKLVVGIFNFIKFLLGFYSLICCPELFFYRFKARFHY